MVYINSKGEVTQSRSTFSLYSITSFIWEGIHLISHLFESLFSSPQQVTSRNRNRRIRGFNDNSNITSDFFS
eukprot:maker-scaffold_7-snap-gene-9.2-mRNA-1 protein AED:0.30 eAED:0.30 QI:78/1/0.5/1/0/0/2/0/71